MKQQQPRDGIALLKRYAAHKIETLAGQTTWVI